MITLARPNYFIFIPIFIWKDWNDCLRIIFVNATENLTEWSTNKRRTSLTSVVSIRIIKCNLNWLCIREMRTKLLRSRTHFIRSFFSSTTRHWWMDPDEYHILNDHFAIRHTQTKRDWMPFLDESAMLLLMMVMIAATFNFQNKPNCRTKVN